jgi:hypothetical protein
MKSYRVDGNCSLIRGWAKHSALIDGQFMPRVKPVPTMAVIDMANSTIQPCIDIPDPLNPCHNSYIFLPARAKWPEFFVKRIQELVNDEDFILNAQQDLSDVDDDEDENNNDDDSMVDENS